MVSLQEVVAFLDQTLNTAGISDYPGAINGLQLENGGKIGRVVAAVDASLPVIQAVAAGGPGLLIVHHGMFWQGSQPIKGAFYQKLKTAIDAGLAIYSSHLPLDIHPQLGNNALLGQALGVEGLTPFSNSKGAVLGVEGTWSGTRQSLHHRMEELLGRVHVCPAGPENISKIGIITGGAGSEVAAMAARGLDAFITGEGPHWSYPLAEELGLNVFYGGHYATETFGVKALAQEISKIFTLPYQYHDHPSGL